MGSGVGFYLPLCFLTVSPGLGAAEQRGNVVVMLRTGESPFIWERCPWDRRIFRVICEKFPSSSPSKLQR